MCGIGIATMAWKYKERLINYFIFKRQTYSLVTFGTEIPNLWSELPITDQFPTSFQVVLPCNRENLC